MMVWYRSRRVARRRAVPAPESADSGTNRAARERPADIRRRPARRRRCKALLKTRPAPLASGAPPPKNGLGNAPPRRFGRCHKRRFRRLAAH